MERFSVYGKVEIMTSVLTGSTNRFILYNSTIVYRLAGIESIIQVINSHPNSKKSNNTTHNKN